MNRRELMQGIVLSAIAAGFPESTLGESSVGIEVPSARPRLYLNERTLAHLRARFMSDSAWRTSILHDGNVLLATEFFPESVAEEGGGAQAHYARPARQIASMSVTLGLLYRLTNEERYAAKLFSGLQHYAGYVRWGGQGLADRDPSWHAELDTAQFCFGFANGYDTLYPELSPDKRQQVRDAMVRLGILPTLDDWVAPGKRFHSLDSMGHNWWGVCVSGAGVAALSLVGDDPRAQQWIRWIDEGFMQWFTYAGNALHNRIETFETEGGPSYEGVHYTGFAISSYLRYVLAWQNLFPQRKPCTRQFLIGMPEFWLHSLYPASSGSLPVNFDDCTSASTAADSVLLLRACGIDNAYSRVYLQHANGTMEDPLSAYVGEVSTTAGATFPLSKVYPKMGWAMMRDSWQPDSTLLAVKSGYTWNHAHADASSFQLMHRGSRLIIDSGWCNYGRSEYSSYYRQSIAHNVVLFGGKGQPIDQINIGAKFPGSILNWFDGLGMKYICADGTGPVADQAARHYRHFLWVGDVVLIIDDIATHNDVQLDWLLHTAGTTQQDGPRTLRLQNDRAAASLSMLYPDSGMIEQRDGLAPEHPDEHIPYHAFVFKTHNRKQRAIFALDLAPAAPTKVTLRELSRYLEVTVETTTEMRRVYLNLRSIDGAYDMSSTIAIDDWLTDAYLFAIAHPLEAVASPESSSQLFVMDGSFLRHRGESVMESLSKASCLWNRSSQMQVYSQGQDNLNLSFSCPQRPTVVIWNGKATQSEYDATTRLLHLCTYAVP